MCGVNRFSYIALFMKAVLSIVSMRSMNAIARGIGYMLLRKYVTCFEIEF